MSFFAMIGRRHEEGEAPVFIIADDDKGALDRITEYLHPEWYYVTVTKPRLVAKYAKRLPVAAIFLAEPVDYPQGGAPTLLRHLLEAVSTPVIILSERWTPEIAEEWKLRGATDCLPHPTRYHERLDLLRSKMQSLAFGARTLGNGKRSP